MATLKVNYVDSVYTGNKKYSMSTNSDNTFSFTDKTSYSVEGDTFAASDVNATNTQINTNTSTISDLSNATTTHFTKWIKKIYPVGSIYLTLSDTNPGTLFPGTTWERIYDSFLYGAGVNYGIGETGGEINHTLTTDEMPAHRHRFAMDNSTGGYIAKDGRPRAVVNGYSTTAAVGKNGVFTDKVSTTYNGDVLEYVGGGLAHNNMPPFLAVYIWKRTA